MEERIFKLESNLNIINNEFNNIKIKVENINNKLNEISAQGPKLVILLNLMKNNNKNKTINNLNENNNKSNNINGNIYNNPFLEESMVEEEELSDDSIEKKDNNEIDLS